MTPQQLSQHLDLPVAEVERALANLQAKGLVQKVADITDVRANATDYDRVVIEMFHFYGSDTPKWALPDWNEMGLPGLAGPFATFEEADKVAKEASE